MITIHTKTITESTAGFCDIIDITAKFREQVRAACMRSGSTTLFVNPFTAAGCPPQRAGKIGFYSTSTTGRAAARSSFNS